MITIFEKFSSIGKPHITNVEAVFKAIKEGKVKEQIEKIRNEADQEAIGKLKMELPAVLYAGIFDIPITKTRADGSVYESFRNDKSLSIHSKLIPIDVDDVDPIKYKADAHKDPYIFALWSSPSGTGVHGLIKIADGNKHEEHYNALLKRYPIFDPTARNPSRILFMSYDPDMYINYDSKVFFEVIENIRNEGMQMTGVSTDYSKLNIASKMIQKAEIGQRHHSVIKASYLVGGWVSGGLVEESIAKKVLEYEVLKKFGAQEAEAEFQAVEDGVKAGQYMPINELATYERTAIEEMGLIDEELSFLVKNEVDEEYIRRYRAGLIPMGLPFGYDDMDKYLLLKEGEFYALLSHAHTGKAQPLSSKILTPKGWKLMGDTSVGDEIVGLDGKPQEILGIYPQGERDVYKVTISDGTHVYCDKEHLWTVNRYYMRHHGKNDENGINRYISDTSFITIPLSEMIGKEKLKGERKNGINNFRLPSISPIQFTDIEVPIDPYLLGSLLGDGCISSTTNPNMTTADVQTLELITSMEHVGNYNTRKKENRKDVYTIRMKPYIKQKLIELGLYGCKSNNKFIPNIYIYNSIEKRLELLKGLMDTDGSVDKNGSMSFSTISPMLRDGIIELVNSFGGRCLVKSKTKHYTSNGIKKQGQLCYNISIKMPSGIIPFKLDRKLKLINPKRYQDVYKYIEKIEYSHKEQCQCIRVSNEDSLYITDNYIPTHNTALTFWLIFLSSFKYDWGWVVYTGENRTASVKMKMVEHYIGKKIKDCSEAEFQEALKWVNERMFFINNDSMYSYDDLLKYTEKVSKFHSIKGLFIDPINALKVKGSNKYDSDMEMYTDMLLFTKRTNISVFVALHTRSQSQRERDNNGNQLIPFPADADGGAVLYNKVDIFLTMNRNIQDPQTWMVTEIYVNKMRNKDTGGDTTPRGQMIKLKMNKGIEFTDENGWLPIKRKGVVDDVVYTQATLDDIINDMETPF
jgi:hypothetical protein